MVKLYTTGCPKCLVLESKLQSKAIEFEKCEDVKFMISKGFMSSPMLEVDEAIMNYMDAIKWVKEQ